MRRLQQPVTLIWLAITAFCYSANAQLTADFTANVQSGCSPLVVTFSDQSGGGNITFRHWEFGNGNVSTGNNTSPTATYLNKGLYNVTLTVSDGTDTATVTKTSYIEVYENPEVDFAFSTGGGCIPFTVHFNDLSAGGSGNITSYTWDFGDGSPTGTQQNLSHTYTSPGIFTVSLQVTDDNGCTSFKDSVGIINAAEKPTANLNVNGPRESCSAPLTVNFVNTGSTGSTLNFDWTFGDGGSSNQENPSHTYNSSGTFDVTLIVSHPNGCADTIAREDYVKIVPTQANFTVADTVCVGDSVPFQNLSQGASTFNWDFGNNTTSTARNPVAIYNAPGTYTVQLVASAGTNCQDVTTKNIYVQEVTANFSIDSAFACSTPVQIQYIDSSSSNVTSWKWVFDDNLSTTNPITVFGKDPTRTVFLPMVTSDRLVVETSAGCKDSISLDLFEVAVPEASASLSQTMGCAPLKVVFTDNSISKDSIVSSVFVVDTFTTTAAQTDSFTFTQPGNYEICLGIETSLGCIDTTCYNIVVGEAPNIAFIQENDTACASKAVIFEDKSQDSTKVDFWEWAFQDGSGPETGSLIGHMFEQLGWIDMRYVVGIGGCYDTLDLDSVIYIQGPISYVEDSFNCNNPLTYHFTGSVTGGNRWLWDFGDSLGFDSTSLNPTYTYGTAGDYDLVFYGYNDSTGCVFEKRLTVKARDPVASLSVNKPMGCAPLQVKFNASATTGATPFGYHWKFGNGASFSFSSNPPAQVFPQGGVFSNRLIVDAENQCSDTLFQTIRVFDPEAQMVTPSSPGCSPYQAQFQDASVSDTLIKNYTWLFGDGDTSFQQNPVHVYNLPDSMRSAGAYTYDTVRVSFIIEDDAGCLDTAQHDLVIYEINAHPKIDDTALCVAEPIGLQDSLGGSAFTSKWRFGNGDSALGNPVAYNYPDTGRFRITYVKQDTLGCTLVDSLDNKVSVQKAVAPKFTASPRDTTCFPAKVVFRDTSDSWFSSKRIWNVGSGGGSIVVNDSVATFTYNTSGEFTVTLVLETENGCSDTTVKTNYIHIGGPKADIEAVPDTVCKGDDVDFKIKTQSNIGSLFIDFGDGNDTSLASADTLVSYRYDQTGTINPVFILSDTAGMCQKSLVRRVFVHQVFAGYRFTTDSLGCRPVSLGFEDLSSGATDVTWSANGIEVPVIGDSAYTFETVGMYNFKQHIVNSATGCADSVIKPVVVYPKPVIRGIGDTVLCEGTDAVVNLSGAQKYGWSPAAGLSTDSGAVVVIEPSRPSGYRIIGVDQNGCIDTLNFSTSIQQKPELTLTPASDTTIYQGESVQLSATTNTGVVYFWYPFQDITCDDCPDPVASPLETTTYEIQVADPNGCFIIDSTVTINVVEALSADVPTMFTPNGDGINDKIYVKGWGIKELVEFTVFNRWGEKVFESNSLNVGWDGTYKGTPQNMDTYVYFLTAKGYNGEEVNKKGYITLTR